MPQDVFEIFAYISLDIILGHWDINRLLLLTYQQIRPFPKTLFWSINLSTIQELGQSIIDDGYYFVRKNHDFLGEPEVIHLLIGSENARCRLECYGFRKRSISVNI